MQDALHEFGLSSLASSESHIRHQLAAVRARLGDEASHPKERFSLPEARALLQQRTQALFGTLVPGAPHLMVTFERAFLDDADIVERLLRAGMTVARLNCAHDDEATWLALIGLVRAASARTGLSCAIYMDLGGPKLRTVLRGVHGPHHWIEVREGERLPFVEADTPLAEDELAVACQEVGIVGQLRAGDRVLFDDGLIEGVVMSTGVERASLRVSRVSARKPRLRGEKGMNFPDTSLSLPSLTVTDRAHLPFIRAHADMVGYSFLRSAGDLAVLRTALEGPGEGPHIILKIETRESVRDLPAILLEAMHQPLFGVMIARGDLAVEIGFERLSEIQEEILWLAEAAHAPVIWATQVLETLNKRGIATRAEITDASFAVRAECVLLNKGPRILKVIDTLRDILARSGGHHEKKRYRMRPMSIARHFLEGATPSTRTRMAIALDRGKNDPWKLKTPPGTSDYTMHVDEKDGRKILVCTVGKTVLHYDTRAVADLHAMLKKAGDWVDLGGADEQKPVKDGTVEAWGRSPDNPVGGWYGLKKGFRGRFGVYLPPLLEALGLCELEHNARDNRMRAK